MDTIEKDRGAKLLEAQQKADRLFKEIERHGIIRPGVAETQVNQDIYDLAERMYGISTYWHKRIVRAGRNTLAPYDENPPDLTISHDDILFLDLGPVFEDWEADFGRTFVVGSDPVKLKLRDDVARGFADGKRYFDEHPDITAAELFRHAEDLACKYGWEFGGPIAGHLIGQFPHERIPGDKISLYVHPDNPLRMRDLDADGKERIWILEIHFVDRVRGIGGFYEELLSVG
ncbi:MAG TPA: M24 family metallopeptidase [Candidatus Acidoferrales bacterium]